jgi:PAS domain S-box-containing protein
VDALVVGEPGRQRVYTLRAADEAYRAFVEVMCLGAATVSPEGTILYCNHWLVDRLGYPLERTIGGSIFRFVDPQDEFLLRAMLWEAITAHPIQRQFTMYTSSGVPVPVQLTATPVTLDGMRHICVIVTDLTEHEALLAAQGASHAKDRFLAILSHELRTPLTPVMMTASSLAMDPDLPKHARDGFAMIQRYVELETKLIDDLLDLSRLTAGKLRLQLGSVEVHALVGAVVEMLRGELHLKSMSVKTELDARQTVVRGDSARLHQVLWNLIRNAIKFSNEGGQIRIRTQNDDPHWMSLEVIDHGIGIEREMLSRIFNAFEQAEHHGRPQGGLGLGLSIARAICELHGGSIRAESQGTGHGASMILRLPLSIGRELEPDQPRDPAPAACTPAEPAHPRALRVLIVEDHAETATVLARLLTLDGHDVRTANSVAVALELAGAESFDLIVSDIGLPDGTGHDLMRAISRQKPIPGIALTGYGREDDVSRSREAGFVAHVVKPINVDELQAVINRVAAGRQ